MTFLIYSLHIPWHYYNKNYLKRLIEKTAKNSLQQSSIKNNPQNVDLLRNYVNYSDGKHLFGDIYICIVLKINFCKLLNFKMLFVFIFFPQSTLGILKLCSNLIFTQLDITGKETSSAIHFWRCSFPCTPVHWLKDH